MKINDTSTYAVNALGLIELLLDQPWHKNCEIIEKYMPPFPHKNTVPIVAIRYNNGKEHTPFLRYSAGPLQGFFWDVYGEDFQTVELAVLALSKAPAPIDVSPIVFKLPLNPKK